METPPGCAADRHAPALGRDSDQAQGAAFSLQSRRQGGLAAAVRRRCSRRLSIDEKSILVLLRENGSARSSELAERLKKNPGRLNGLMRRFRRTLHAEGHVLFTDEVLPSGETMYRYKRRRSADGRRP